MPAGLNDEEQEQARKGVSEISHGVISGKARSRSHSLGLSLPANSRARGFKPGFHKTTQITNGYIWDTFSRKGRGAAESLDDNPRTS